MSRHTVKNYLFHFPTSWSIQPDRTAYLTMSSSQARPRFFQRRRGRRIARFIRLPKLDIPKRRSATEHSRGKRNGNAADPVKPIWCHSEKTPRCVIRIESSKVIPAGSCPGFGRRAASCRMAQEHEEENRFCFGAEGQSSKAERISAFGSGSSLRSVIWARYIFRSCGRQSHPHLYPNKAV